MSHEISVADAHRSGHVAFMGLDLLVGPGALVPRNETELLGRTALEAVRAMKAASPRVIDMCCGAGNLVCALASYIPGAKLWAADLTDGCVDLARRNVEQLGLAGRVAVRKGDLFGALAGLDLEGTIDAIVCNPPYISEKRLTGDRAHLLELEPREAFAAGPYGLGIHMRVVRDAPRFLRPGGVLLFEVGLGQDRQVTSLFERARVYENVRTVANDAGEGRVVLANTLPAV